MKIFISNLHGQSDSSTAMIAQNTVTDIAKGMWMNELPISYFPINSLSLEQMAERAAEIANNLSRDDVIILQLPTWNGIAFDEILIESIKKRQAKMIAFVHDFVPYMFAKNYYLLDRYLNAYNQTELLILPSQKMGDMMTEAGLKKKFVIQELWDHHVNIPVKVNQEFNKNKVVFAGSLTRFPFIWDLDGQLDVDVFSNDQGRDNSSIHIKGWQPDAILIHELANSGAMGLVWSENFTDRPEREYSKINASYKLSTYLAAGIPVILREENAKAEIVSRYGAGLIVNELDDLKNKLNEMSQEDINQMREHAKKLGFLIRHGEFTRKVLVDSIFKAIGDEKNENI
ncbi:beta-1,6-galactofuranosyltransferase [Weissella diestrammenae]|uniref:Beta-1,6-galactofuranosyltransferase n=1 Tax=Weissella diestrammenae TaxID=1162633 RepID=A0A7G9T5H6_9LACO|nr:beta-1,6-galactofuranosyltransferase [Weissella diestrammenae]MCM0583212.1 beta-1,6-galactofuranosyltransferase [Weissella diestrammenae]QNN75351.1 beta-1,6-galactofuranosyltransferase [Weissella diestrammenae]